jgi:hypothetical protein
MRYISVISRAAFLALCCFAASPLSIANAGAASSANCAACVSSYHCDSYQQTCAKDCAAKEAAGGSCATNCGDADKTCLSAATAECKEYCQD